MKDEDLTPTQLWRKHRLRQVMLFVTVPGVLLGHGQHHRGLLRQAG